MQRSGNALADFTVNPRVFFISASEKIRGHGIPEALEAILLGRSRLDAKVERSVRQRFNQPAEGILPKCLRIVIMARPWPR